MEKARSLVRLAIPRTRCKRTNGELPRIVVEDFDATEEKRKLRSRRNDEDIEDLGKLRR